MNISIDLIEYYWDLGVFDQAKMCQLVEDNIISTEDFHYITRSHYYAIKEKIKKQGTC